MNSTFIRIIVFLIIFSSALWFGGSVVRSAIAFDAFIPGTLVLKSEVSEVARFESLRLYSTTGFYTSAAYILLFTCTIIFVFAEKGKFKERGWLFISLVLFFIFSTVEWYRLYFDVQLIRIFNNESALTRQNEAFRIFLKLFNPQFSAASLLAFFTYVTIVFFLAFRPLHKSPSL
ncbi:MAG TPA: hypothetical protein VEC36_08950 [Patescibacteria group bacterium]|nr:hypothetical protein [Patescibacteria group bacterium]